jgi:hypothetical protein
MIVSSNATRDLLPPQIIFTSFTFRTLPPNSKRKINRINDGWDFSFSENH